MHDYMLYHRHSSRDCATCFAAWHGFDSPLRGSPAISTCTLGAHEIWWHVRACDDRDALARLPSFVATRAIAIRVAPVDIP